MEWAFVVIGTLLALVALLCLWAAFAVLRAAANLFLRIEACREQLEKLERRLSANGRGAAGALALWVACAGSVQGQQTLAPADALALALADLRQQPAGTRASLRYLTLYAVAEPQREALRKVLAYHVNALSREPDIVPPVVVPGSAGTLLRVHLADYDWSAAVWEKLEDPLFHVKVQAQATKKLWSGGVWPGDGKHYPAGSFYVTEPAKQTALAPWLPAAAAAELVNLSQSAAPIVRGDWFLWQTAIQQGRDPGYYQFLGIKNLADYEKLVGFDAKLMTAAKRKELLEAVAVSTITLQPRRLARFPVIEGWYWRSFDTALARNGKNALRILDGDTFDFDASETLGLLPNGLMVSGLFNKAGATQDVAPPDVAPVDFTAPQSSVHVNLSCIRCHFPNSGINPIDGWARNLFTGPLTLQGPDEKVIRDLRQKYLRPLESAIEGDRKRLATAVTQATGGMKPPELAAAYGRAFAEYDAPVTLERAARDAGVTPERLTGALKAHLRTTGSLDTVLASFLTNRRGGVKPDQYHEAIPLIQTALRGLVP